MKGGKQPHGFTIVEALIFLAVSGILLFSAITLINGKQSKTEFSQGIRQIQNDLQSVISQVAAGDYVSDGGFSCKENNIGSSNNVVISGAGAPQGTNFGCQFIGEGIQFGPPDTTTGQHDQYIVYPLAGAEYANTDLTPITDITQADVTPLSPGFSPNDLRQTIMMPNGITVSTINGSTAGSPAVIVITTLSPPSSVTGQQQGTLNGGNDVNLVGISGTQIGQNSHQAETSLKDMCSSGPACSYNQHVDICFDSGSSNQSGIITIGSSNNTSPLGVSLKIQSHHCP